MILSLQSCLSNECSKGIYLATIELGCALSFMPCSLVQAEEHTTVKQAWQKPYPTQSCAGACCIGRHDCIMIAFRIAS